MSEQQTPQSPVFCKMGCGFFGSDVTGWCCSKCWIGSLNKEPTNNNNMEVPAKKTLMVVAQQESELEEPMEICRSEAKLQVISSSSSSTSNCTESVVSATSTTTKKKKKTSYKAMMASMMNGNDDETTKADKEREKLTKGLGGGAFTKVDKI